MGVKHYIIVELCDMNKYIQAVKNMNLLAEILLLDIKYKKNYELCDDLGFKKSTGPGPARNFAWEHSMKNGFEYHWVMDDNIKNFQRMYKSKRIEVKSPSFWKAQEDFMLRYKNVAMGGPCYSMFAFRDKMETMPPFIKNTRIYSCNFIKNDIPFRWRGRYNEDTILSLDILKAGYCTIQFYAFLQNKMATQAIKGGNTDEFYHKEGILRDGERYADDGTLAKSQMQVDVHPDVSRLVFRFGRIHHYVDYTPFKKTKLIKKKNITIKKDVENYGMELKKRK